MRWPIAGEPEETIGLLRHWRCQVIAGNCEEKLAAGLPIAVAVLRRVGV